MGIHAKRGIYLFLTAFVLLIIFYFSIVPLTFPGEPGFMDKIKHFFAYFLLSFFMYENTKKFKLAVFLSGTYGFLMEALQFTIPLRCFSFFDILINFLGAFSIFPLVLLSGKKACFA